MALTSVWAPGNVQIWPATGEDGLLPYGSTQSSCPDRPEHKSDLAH